MEEETDQRLTKWKSRYNGAMERVFLLQTMVQTAAASFNGEQPSNIIFPTDFEGSSIDDEDFPSAS